MTERREGFIDSMCMTWRHDFGLHHPEGDAGFLSSGMTTAERAALRRDMGQIYSHHVEPLIARIRELERAQTAESGIPEPRFFMDHGMWHDRVTGKHLYTQDQYDEMRETLIRAGEKNNG